ncbi:MAG: hypothetical protein A2V90_08880 [Gammaproteobacteria bacterium RBG_16_57_12]|nr:MAG: hypothetical protein A2V90_08880 [Gammaproteobacteria bacterium RBG_16_57_12]
MLPRSLLAGIELTLNKGLSLDPATLEKLADLSGKVIALELKGLGLKLYLLPGAAGLAVLGEYPHEPQVTLRGTLLAMARLGLTPRGSDALFGGEVELRGDLALGQQFSDILKGVDIDWEEMASRVVGDVAAHQLGNALRAGLGWGRAAAATLRDDAGEYLREESGLLPPRFALDEYHAGVDKLRCDADRLAARVKRLHHAVFDTQ